MPLSVRQKCGTFHAILRYRYSREAFLLPTAQEPLLGRRQRRPWGLSLGFRRTVKGEGVWVAKIVVDGRRIEERIGTPDGDGTVPGALTFPSAVEAAVGWGRQQAASVVAAWRPRGRSRERHECAP